MRELMHPKRRANEAYEREPESNYRRDGHASRIGDAIEMRRQLPQPVAHIPWVDGLPAWRATADVLAPPRHPGPVEAGN